MNLFLLLLRKAELSRFLYRNLICICLLAQQYEYAIVLMTDGARFFYHKQEDDLDHFLTDQHDANQLV